jgi:hypothetical protein
MCLTLVEMADDEREPTQKTPKGADIPIPKREAVSRDLMTRVEAVEREPGVVTLARKARGLGVAPAELWREVA